MDTSIIAKAIAESNKGKGSYVIRFTTGKLKGMYLGTSQCKPVKTRRAARSTIAATKESWANQLRYTPFENEDYEIICLKEPETKSN